MGYTDMVKAGANATDIKEYLANGEMVPITIRIPKNLRDSAKEAAFLQGMSFSALVRKGLIETLSKESAQSQGRK